MLLMTGIEFCFATTLCHYNVLFLINFYTNPNDFASLESKWSRCMKMQVF